jgi:signal peptidase
MKRSSILWTIWALVAVAVVGFALTVHLMGVSVYVITGASMTGAISKGSIAFDRNVPIASLEVGDIITFRPPGDIGNVTHRIIEVQQDTAGNPVFRTKGDANEAVDPWLFTFDKSVQAKYSFHIPYVGYVLAAFTFRAVRTAVLALVALVIIWLTVSWLRKTPRQEDDEESAAGGQATLDRPAGMTLYQTGEAA